MNVRMVHRPARDTAPMERPEPRALATPPPLGDAPPGGIPLQSLLPVVGSLSSITMMVVLRGNPMMVVVGGMILVVALVGGVGMAVSSRGRQVRQRRVGRERYLDYLERLRIELRVTRGGKRATAHVLNPAPEDLGEVVRNPARLWERRRRDTDFLSVRVGSATVQWFGLSIPDDPNPVQPFDPMMTAAAQQVCTHYDAIPGMPLTVDLARTTCVSIVAPAAAGRALGRAMLAQIAALHSPDDVSVGLVVGPDAVDAWVGADTLPHATLNGTWDGPMSARRVAPTARALMGEMHDELAARVSYATSRRGSDGMQFGELVVIEDVSPGATAALPIAAAEVTARDLGIVHVALVENRLDEPENTDVRITLSADGSSLEIQYLGDATGDDVEGHPDALSPQMFAALTGAIAPLRLSLASRTEGTTAAAIGPLDLLGVDVVSDLSPQCWAITSGPEFLRVSVGTDDAGRALSVDIKEGAQGGMGPHGICIGATGSGKSEFLRTFVLGLAAKHGPEDLAMILVDYKGGAAFAPLAALPHVSGLIDNLEGDAGLVERARASINGEVVRRQRQLKEAGSLASITEYREARETHPSLAPMPHLFVVIDEFGELLTAEPEFVNLLLTIGRIGRSIGVHMLLSSQRIESGKLRGLDTYLSYRIGLRTFSESESQVVLNTGDAFHLPPEPGWGFLKVDTTVYTRFRSGYVSGPTPGPMLEVDEGPATAVELPQYNDLADSLADTNSVQAPHGSAKRQERLALIDDVVARLRPGVTSTNSVWLPPLPDRLPLFQILDLQDRESLTVPMGLIDDPARQSQATWLVNLDASGGHHAVIGAPQSGRSTFLRAFAAGIATTHTPAQVTMYGLDLTGASLSRLEGFPHVGGIVTRHHTDQHVRLLEELHAMLADRERLFRDQRIESLAHFRSRHAAGEMPSVVSPDVVLLVDGYGLIRTDFEQLEAPMGELLTRGGSFGIHLVIGLTRWAEVTMRHQPLIGNRYELRLNDPTESTIARKLAETIKQPGRILTQDKLFAQVALPRIDDGPDEQSGEALTALANRTAADWQGPSAAPIRLLPESLDPATLPSPFDEPDRVPLGLRQDTMVAEMVDFAGRDPHLLVLGDPGSGKSTVLRQILAGIAERYGPDEVVVALMEPRGSLVSVIHDDYLGGHATNGPRARELAAAVATEMVKRRDGESDARMRVFVVVDDFDILSAGNTTPLEPLLPFLPQARDLGLSVILTRPVAGASRAMFENTMQTVRDVGATGILLSGERSEGALWPGVYATPSVPGRARIVRRAEPPRLMQVANREDAKS